MPGTTQNQALVPTEVEEFIKEVNAESSSEYNPLKIYASINLDRWYITQEGAEEPIEKIESLDGQVIYARIYRSYRQSREQKAPSCVSMDGGISGTVNAEFANTMPFASGQACASCPFNQWGTAINDAGVQTRGKACGERRKLLMLLSRYSQPVIVNISPTSSKKWDAYASSFASLTPASAYVAHKTQISIKIEKGEGGSKYGTAVFKSLGRLSTEEILVARALREAFREAIAVVTTTEEQEIRTADNAEETKEAEEIKF